MRLKDQPGVHRCKLQKGCFMIVHGLCLKRTSRINAGHLWVFSNELSTSPKKFEPGSLVELQDKNGLFLGIGYINPHSLIAVRILTFRNETVDEDFFRNRVSDAISYRKRFISGLT